MPEYMITYLGGEQPSSQEEGQRHFARYMEWISNLGDAAVSPANPLAHTHVVDPDGNVTAGGTTTMSGFSLVQADSIDAALLIAKSCPFLELNGSLEVSELMQMPAAK